MICGPALEFVKYADEAYVSNSTLLGNVGYFSSMWMYKETLKELKIDVSIRTKGEHKMRLERTKPFKQEDIDWWMHKL